MDTVLPQQPELYTAFQPDPYHVTQIDFDGDLDWPPGVVWPEQVPPYHNEQWFSLNVSDWQDRPMGGLARLCNEGHQHMLQSSTEIECLDFFNDYQSNVGPVFHNTDLTDLWQNGNELQSWPQHGTGLSFPTNGQEYQIPFAPEFSPNYPWSSASPLDWSHCEAVRSHGTIFDANNSPKTVDLWQATTKAYVPGVDWLPVGPDLSPTTKYPDANMDVWYSRHHDSLPFRDAARITSWECPMSVRGNPIVSQKPKHLEEIGQPSSSGSKVINRWASAGAFVYTTDSDSVADTNEFRQWNSLLIRDSQPLVQGAVDFEPKIKRKSMHHSKAPNFKCSSCHPHQRFTSKRSLVRHMKTKHQPKAFTCPRCIVGFTRKDALARHEAQKHSWIDNIIRCTACGRYLSKRAFPEHLESNICRRANALAIQGNFQSSSVKFVGADDDPFLAALQTLRLFGVDTQNGPVITVRLKLQLREEPQESRTLIQYQSCVMYLLRHEYRYLKAVPLRLGLTIWLLGNMANCRQTGEYTYWGLALERFKLARRLFNRTHDFACDCNDYEPCRQWSPFARRNPEIAILTRMLNGIGVYH